MAITLICKSRMSKTRRGDMYTFRCSDSHHLCKARHYHCVNIVFIDGYYVLVFKHWKDRDKFWLSLFEAK